MKLLALLFLTLPSLALACQFDTDCQPGSTCAKQSGQLNGVCYGGIQPGNQYDQKPVRDALDPNHKVGNTCQFDVDCGPGNSCAKPASQVYGVCVRR